MDVTQIVLELILLALCRCHCVVYNYVRVYA